MDRAQIKSASGMRRFIELATENHSVRISGDQNTRLMPGAPAPDENLKKPEMQKSYLAGENLVKLSIRTGVSFYGSLLVTISVSADQRKIAHCAEFLESLKRGAKPCDIWPHRESDTSGFCAVAGYFCESIKKGADCDRALWLCASVDHSSGVSAFALRRWRRLISPFTDATTKPAVLSPSSFTFSSSSITSSGMRDTICCDLLLREPVAISVPPCNRWHSFYVKLKLNQYLKWHSLSNSMVNATCRGRRSKTAKPGSAGTLTGPLTTIQTTR